MADTSSQPQQPPSPALEREQLTVSRRRPGFEVLAAVIGLGFVAGLVLLIYLVHPPTTRLSYAALAARSWQVLAFSAAIGYQRAGEPREWVFYSKHDWVLTAAFPLGERLQGEGGGQAVGRGGRPQEGRWHQRQETKMGHGDYWRDTERVVMDKVPAMLGLAVSRGLQERPVGGRQRRLPVRLQQARSLRTPLAKWSLLIRENGSLTDEFKNLIGR